MKELIVECFSDLNQDSTTEEITAALSGVSPELISEVSWPDFPYKPSVNFRMAYTADSILLKYEVIESHVRATYREINDPVYKDSCVEFFVSFDGIHYYNLEFNSLGTALVGYGSVIRAERFRLSNEVIEAIRAYPHQAIKLPDTGESHWELLLNIPFSVFQYDILDQLRDTIGRANFYKCGDELPEPHYIAWNRIEYPVPNFHQPASFGQLLFR